MFEPISMKNVDLILGDVATGTNFKCQLTSVNLNPDTNIIRLKTLCPTGQYADVEEPEWTLELGYAYGVDAQTATAALAEYLRANAGDKVDYLFRPRAGGPGYNGTCTLVPGGIGGEQGNFSTKTVSLPVEGQPVPVAAIP